MNYLKVITILSLTLAFFSCKKEDAKQTTPTIKSVYVAGAIRNDGDNKFKAVYWKDGKLAANLGGLGDNSVATDIVVDDENTVYACGYVTTATGNKACYWKKKTTDNYVGPTYLDAVGVSLAYKMLLVGSDVYIVGYDNGSVPKYWKNGIGHNISDTSISGQAKCIAVNDAGDLFFGGFQQVGANQIGKVWSTVEPKVTTYNTGLGNVGINSISIPKHNIYAAGYYRIKPTVNAATYWSSDVPHVLSDTTKDGNAFGIKAVINGNTTDIYVVGVDNEVGLNKQVFLNKNGVRYSVSEGPYSSVTSGGLFVDGNDVYVAFGESVDATNFTYKGKYKKNNEVITLEIADDETYSIAGAIYVK